MLAADKLLLQSNVKQRSIELREKELKLFNQNFSAICTQSAIMAGFTLTTFVEIDLPPEKKLAKTMLHFFVTCSICVNFTCVAMVTFVNVWGGGKALRGEDGSMDYAVDAMNSERTFIFSLFGAGVLATLGCVFAVTWILMEPEVAMFASVIVLSAFYMVCSEARRIRQRFRLEDDEATSFSDLRSIFPTSSQKRRDEDDSIVSPVRKGM